MTDYKVWDADNDEEPEWANRCCLTDTGPRDAARAWAEEHHANNDYPVECTVCVRDETGTLTRWTVYAEHRVTFRAERVD